MKKHKNIITKNTNTIFSKFLIIFVFLTIIVISITIFNIVYENKKEHLYEIRQENYNLVNKFNKTNLLIDIFFIRDVIDPNFYTDSTTKSISSHDSLFQMIKLEVINFSSLNKFMIFDSTSTKEQFAFKLDNYQNIVDSIVKLSLQRGFVDFGIVGKMRFYAHKLESFDFFDNTKTLMLRRHEKDYLIRRQKKYIELFHQKFDLYKKETIESNLPKNQKDSIINTLDLYKYYFDNVVQLDSILGFKAQSGLSKRLMQSRISLESEIMYISKKVKIYIKNTEKRYKFIYILLSSLVILFSFSIGLGIIRYITRPISKLSENIKIFIESNFEVTQNFEYKTKITELVTLNENYFKMKQEILGLLNDFQQKVSEKTEEVKSQNEQIERQKSKVENINKDLISSIKYAKKIQDAIIPNENQVKTIFEKNFVIYKPKNIVSGDFLWLKSIKTKKYNLKLLAVADCTGHGVPGALMSMLSIAYLNEIILRKDVLHANEVLEIMRLNIISNFQYDGLDMSFVIFDENTKQLEFAGANRNIFIKRDKELFKIKGNRMPIGKYPTTSLFENKIFNYQKGDVFFAFTDGITDQLSQENGKLGTKNLLKIIIENDDFITLKTSVLNYLKDWKKSTEQTDDILFFGTLL